MTPSQQLESLLAAFRAGDAAAQNQLLERYRPWLSLLARVQMESCLQAKFDPSDVVQQTMVEACRAAPQFRGSAEQQWLAWMRQILAHTLAHEIRRYRSQKRDAAREQSIQEQLDQSSMRMADALPANDTSPTQRVARQERDVLLAQLLDKLQPDHREVIILRNLEGLTHEQIAQRMNRSAGAVRMLWIRALAALKEAVDGGQRTGDRRPKTGN